MGIISTIVVFGIIVLLMARAASRIRKNGVCEGGCAGCPNACNCGKKQ